MTLSIVCKSVFTNLMRGISKLPQGVRAKIDFSRVPKVNPKDVVEKVHRGSGPGGQAAAKTDYAVTLIHTPTKITVRAEESRSQAQNRLIANQKLITALDNFYNKDQSVAAQLQRLEQLKEQRAAESRRKRREEKLRAKQQSLAESGQSLDQESDMDTVSKESETSLTPISPPDPTTQDIK